MQRIVIKRNGKRENFQTQKIINAIFYIIDGLNVEDDYEIVFRIMKELNLKVPEEVRSEELDILVLKAIEQLIPKHSIYDTLASRQLLKLINKRIDKRFKNFKEYIEYSITNNLLISSIAQFDSNKLETIIDYKNDEILNYFGLVTLRDRYLLKDRCHEIIEKPQWFFMRVAMGIGNTIQEIENVYKKLSKLEYLHSTPTLFNSGTPISQFSSCYVNVVEDSLEAIMMKAEETAFLAKYAGGVGTDVTRIRAAGSYIHSLNAKSSGVIPFIKIFDSVINSIQQGGKRRSSQVISIQPWHLDIEAFIDLRETTGNAYFRTPSLNTKLWMPDELMRRIENDEQIYLFDPAECPELVDAYGEDFTNKYQERIKQAEEGKIIKFKKVDGRDFFKKYLFKLAKTGHPWLTFKDEHNRKNPCPDYSVINSSNLCTEISIPNRFDSTAVCTLASLNLAKHVTNDKTDFDWNKIEETIKVMVRALDNILDKNFYPSDAAKRNTMDLRPLGIGVMGFAEALTDLNIPYDSEEAVLIARKIGIFMRKIAYCISQELAEERGTFLYYNAMQEGGVLKKGLRRRNAVLLAIAPTATISIIAGTTSSIDSYFNNVYSRDTLSGKHIVINNKLIADLESKGLWNEEISDIIKFHNGSVQAIEFPEGSINKDLYKTAYEISPQRQIDIAAAFQESIDQAVSKSLYIDEKLRDDMENIYLYAWKKKLKSTYYCFIDKVIKGEKYTSTINKRGARKGFNRSATGQIQQEVSADEKTAEAETWDDDLEKVEAEARAKYGDDVVDKIKNNSTEDNCPADPLLAKLCPSCE
jgi:ribonucleoside-diphosphate reductase alpha chain